MQRGARSVSRGWRQERRRGRLEGHRLEGLRLEGREAAGALPCSVAFVVLKNFDSHAAWRGFYAAEGVPAAGQGTSHAAWRSFL